MANGSDEKFDEKAIEKQEEKSPTEKGWDEKWRRDPLSAIIWAMIFIWAGCVFLAANLGLLDRIAASLGIPGLAGRAGLEAWPIVLVGSGVILLFEVLVRLVFPVYRRPVMGTFIFGMVLIGIGLGDLINWGVIWAVIIIAVGFSILIRGLRPRE